MKKIILFLLLFCHYCYSYSGDVYKLTGENYYTEVKKLISEAKNSIYVSLYMATYNPEHPKSLPNQLINELIEAKKRGLDVKIILDQGSITSSEQYNDMAYYTLKNAGVDVNYDSPSRKLHDKLIVIDNSIVILGSHNWSISALRNNSETSVVIKSPELAMEFIQWIKSIQISPRRTPPPDVNTQGIYLPYKFLTDPELAINFADSTMKLYLYLLKKWEDTGHNTIILDYLEVAKIINLDTYSRRLYRKRINYLLRFLQNRYKLISFKASRRKPAEIDLLDYKRTGMPLNPDPLESFLIPGSFWEFGWMERLSRAGKYFYFISIIETWLSPDPKGWWSHNHKYLVKKYHIHHLELGIIELSQYDILDVEYGKLMPPFEKYFEAPKYLLHPLYSWEWHEEQIKNLETLYGKKKVAKARHWLSVVLEENDLGKIEKLINYANQYGESIVRFAVNKVAKRRIGNQKRSFRYMEGIILIKFSERQNKVVD